jgi:hypothetical protein
VSARCGAQHSLEPVVVAHHIPFRGGHDVDLVWSVSLGRHDGQVDEGKTLFAQHARDAGA